MDSNQELIPWKSSTGYQIGLLHAGIKDPNQIMDDEISDMWLVLTFTKVLMIIWSIILCYTIEYLQCQGENSDIFSVTFNNIYRIFAVLPRKHYFVCGYSDHTIF